MGIDYIGRRVLLVRVFVPSAVVSLECQDDSVQSVATFCLTDGFVICVQIRFSLDDWLGFYVPRVLNATGSRTDDRNR
jgi:hypothetical protein